MKSRRELTHIFPFAVYELKTTTHKMLKDDVLNLSLIAKNILITSINFYFESKTRLKHVWSHLLLLLRTPQDQPDLTHLTASALSTHVLTFNPSLFITKAHGTASVNKSSPTLEFHRTHCVNTSGAATQVQENCVLIKHEAPDSILSTERKNFWKLTK